MSAAITAALAAEAERKRQQAEEESMTHYNQADIDLDWEFKILRSRNEAFKHPAILRRFLREEAEAGWILLEKFDNGRIRLKRPSSAKDQDLYARFNPYRTYVGMSEAQYYSMIFGISIGILIVFFALIFFVIFALG